MGSIIRSSGTVFYSLSCFNSRLGFNGLKYLYSIIWVIVDLLPGNTKKSLVGNRRPECDYSILGRAKWSIDWAGTFSRWNLVSRPSSLETSKKLYISLEWLPQYWQYCHFHVVGDDQRGQYEEESHLEPSEASSVEMLLERGGGASTMIEGDLEAPPSSDGHSLNCAGTSSRWNIRIPREQFNAGNIIFYTCH